jgi:protein gp37
VSDTTAIEWTDATWNPVTGCSKVSPGCAHCYAETISLRFGRSAKPWTPENAAENVVLHPERLDQPLRWRRPRMVFVNSMSDLFHERVPDEFIREVFNVMRRCDGYIVAATERRTPAHTFQVLTKRPERALELARSRKLGFGLDEWRAKAPNVWLGVSIENARYTWRADVLREIPAAVRFISAEPLLGSLVNVPDPGYEYPTGPLTSWPVATRKPLDLAGIDWLIVGGESGHDHRPLDLDHARELRDACQNEGVAFFFKQVGGRTPKSGGRLLDGREWNEMPLPVCAPPVAAAATETA